MSTYHKGDLIRVTGRFTDSNGNAIDPDDVYFQYTNPANTTTTLQYGVDTEVVKNTTGVYYVDINANTPGSWYCRFYSTGSGQAASESGFTIMKSNF